MNEKQMREAAAKIENEWQMGGLYEDFAVEVAKLAVAAERERCAKLCDEAAERLRNSGCKHEAAAVEAVAEDLRA